MCCLLMELVVLLLKGNCRKKSEVVGKNSGSLLRPSEPGVSCPTSPLMLLMRTVYVFVGTIFLFKHVCEYLDSYFCKTCSTDALVLVCCTAYVPFLCSLVLSLHTFKRIV